MKRLDKYLADAGCGTRSEVKQMIRKGRVRVNGQTVRQADTKIDETSDVVAADGQVICISSGPVWYMLHKPAGTVSATTDRREKTVMDLLQNVPGRDLFPVGRLDKDTEGLLLITNDGETAHRLLSPAHHVPKTYQVLLDAPAVPGMVEVFAHGLDIGDPKPAKPAELTVLPAGSFNVPGEVWDAAEEPQNTCGYALVTITEGRFHQVKRMFQAVDRKVLFLRRTVMGPIQLDPSLAPGQYRPLTDGEREALADAVKGNANDH